MSNREKRIETETVHLYLAFARPTHGKKADCIRHVIKNECKDLPMLVAKLQVLGGYWRIHKTVNARDCDKARLWLIHDLIDNPEHASYIDSQWRTALLQQHCKAEHKFMLDIDTSDTMELLKIEEFIPSYNILSRIKSPKGWHYITAPFDTRKVCERPNVTLLRDGYYFVCEVGEQHV